MFDKNITINNYILRFEKDLEYIRTVCTYTTQNLILINVNTKIVTELICSRLKSNGLELDMYNVNDLSKFNTLGELLRNQLNNPKLQNNVLILDFTNELDGFSDSIVDTINVNRDLFSQVYKSTIILTSSQLIYNLRYNAIDFWSCVNLYIDTTKWFCSPIPLPIIKIRTFANATTQLVKFFQKDKITYNQYLELNNEIQKIANYNTSYFEKILQKIYKFPVGICKILLINQTANTLINIKARKNFIEDRINIIKDFNAHIAMSLEYIDVKIMFAEFYYRHKLFDEAITLYQEINQFLANNWDDEQKEIVMNCLSCNLVICKYVKTGIHNPKLLDELKNRMFSENLIVNQEEKLFIDNFLFLIECIIQHHSYAQHKDIYLKLKTNSLCSLPMLDFTETWKIYYEWENFIFNNYTNEFINTGNSILNKIYYYIQKFIRNFCEGHYHIARDDFKVAAGLAKGYGYLQIYDIISGFNKNMIMLYEKN